jgi:glutathione synthase
MKIAFVVNDFEGEKPIYTTTELALAATKLGHEVWYISVGDFTYTPAGVSCARGRRLRSRRFKSIEALLRALKKSESTRVELEALDIIMLRNDPAEDAGARSWARFAGITFGRLAARHGVIVLNDPDGLMRATDKTYFQYFPEEVRPRTLISRDREAILGFIEEQGGSAIVKPLTGSGGHNVFLITPGEANTNQIIDAVCEEGYVIVQERLPNAEKGDVRLLLMNGRPLQCQGKYAAIHRTRGKQGSDIRSNLTAGAQARRARVTDSMLALADMVRPKLVHDGIFLAGLDIIDNKLVEINVFTPGGVNFARELEGVDFASEIIQALECKVDYMRHYHHGLDNAEIATL